MKSLELNWIRKKSDKSIPMPEVVYYPELGASGQYYKPKFKKELFDPDGKPFNMRFGVILINPEFDDIESTIAHEWRHHCQYFRGYKFDGPTWSSCKAKFDYNKALFEYFSQSNCETDALRFEYRHTGICQEWEETLHDLIKDLRVPKIITYGNNTLKSRLKVYPRSSNRRRTHTINKKTRRIQKRIR